MSILERLSERDRAVLRELVSDKIDQLLPLTQAGMPWRATFERGVQEGSRLVSSPEERAWATAQAFILEEIS